MLSTTDLETLIAMKKREIEKEKTLLGLQLSDNNVSEEKEIELDKCKKQVNFPKVLTEHNVSTEDLPEKTLYELEENLPPDLERYIRRYIGLPGMLKAGEYSPNNPLLRSERPAGDALLGLGEYERRRNTLRKLRQRQYREYLDQQAKKKQEAKEQADRERREREQRERELEDREREREEQERRYSSERRGSVNYTRVSGANNVYTTKVDTGVQVNTTSTSTPLSVAVQTDDDHLFTLSPSKNLLTEAERELSPRTVLDRDERPLQPTAWARTWEGSKQERRRSYGDFDERPSSVVQRPGRARVRSEARHSYTPSIFDADAIHLRNLQAEKEAAARRQFYQQELKNQILEQQRIRDERKTREKMLEQAEMRRLEEQLRTLRAAQEFEIDRQHNIHSSMKDNTSQYEAKRKELQKEIDMEHQALLRATIQPKRPILTSRSDKIYTKDQEKRPTYSTNIPDDSIFSPHYDVESYLRRNLNPTKEILLSSRLDKYETKSERTVDKNLKNIQGDSKLIIEKATIHEYPIEKRDSVEVDTLPIPVLRHTPRTGQDVEEKSNLSDAMKIVDDKWKVPAVQKNILKSLPNDEGKSVSILTQLGSIRRQLQLEQLKLDRMLSTDGHV